MRYFLLNNTALCTVNWYCERLGQCDKKKYYSTRKNKSIVTIGHYFLFYHLLE